jgi:hypothetical protein
MTHFGRKLEVKGIAVFPKPRCGDNIKINLKKLRMGKCETNLCDSEERQVEEITE